MAAAIEDPREEVAHFALVVGPIIAPLFSWPDGVFHALAKHRPPSESDGGLAIARATLEKTCWPSKVTGRRGRGTTFMVSLPSG